MNVDPVKKALFFVALTVFLIVFCGSNPSGAFNNEPIELPGLHLDQNTQESANEPAEPLGLHLGLHLAQQNPKTANEQSKNPGDEILDPANEPIELSGMRFSLLMAQQTRNSTDEHWKHPARKCWLRLNRIKKMKPMMMNTTKTMNRRRR